ncbi:hypothetical protein AQUCO_01300777v1 [Aquilegia coerulea]|uniref:Agenet domain-containing protein n=1 Tax=Aquilegia coerulea TaxID=218851 RepID=A0A2G5E3A2_AQUCA|nr:hypothetical protein AQUCO_01300777v1 [Aquilegia coerulea]
MDYEDNDFQSQSFQLAVEENTKFSQGSHSYSLPKFDLDYNLQAHLRFDSLVESEVLLGIRSQEENQWIEDFSRESSGLEFSSGAAESCSISRRNNVWSEVTSSESVDLLLKSVGQDDMLMGQAKIEESDAGDGLNYLTKLMEPNSNKEGFSLPETGKATCVGSISTLDVPIELMEPNSNKDGFALPETGKATCVGSISTLDLPIEQCLELGKDVVEQQSQIDSTSQLEEGENSDDKPLGSKSLDDSSNPECMQVRTSPASVQSCVNSGDLNSDVLQGDEGLEQDNTETVGDHQVLSGVMNVQTCERYTNNTDVNNVGNISSLAQKAYSTLQAMEVRSHTTDTVEISDYEHIISSKDTDMVDQFIGSTQEASFLIAGENISVAHSTAFSGGATEIHSMPIVHFPDQTVQGRCSVDPVVQQGVLSENVSHQMDDGQSLSNAEELPEKDDAVCEGQGNENADDQVHSSSSVREICSSTDVTHDSQIPEDRKVRDVGLGVHSAEVCHTSPLLVEAHPRCDQLLIEDAPCGVWLSRPHVYAVEKENERLPSCSESSGAVLQAATMTSDRIEDGIQNLIQGTSIAKDEAFQQEDLSSSSHANNCSLVVREEEIVTRSSIVPSNLDAKEISQVSTECFPFSEPEHGEVCDTAKEMTCEIVGQSSSSMGISGKMCQNEPESDIADIVVQQQCSERLEESLVVQDVALKDDGHAEVHNEYNIKGVPLEVEGPRSSHGEPQRNPLPSLGESYYNIGLKDLEDNEASGTNNGLSALESTERGVMSSPTHTQTLPPSLGESTCNTDLENLEAEASKCDNTLRSPITSIQGVSLNGGESIVGSVAVSESDAEGHVLEAESSSLNSNEPNCGSPTTISEASQSEKEQLEGKMVSLDVIDSGALEQETNKVIHSVAEPKDSDAFEDDRSFTFKVSSLEELSEKETVTGWKPFPNVQPYKCSQAVGSSCVSPFGSCGIDSKMLENSGNPRISGETNTPESSKCTSEGKTWPTSGKTTKKETAEGKPQKNVVLDGAKVHQDELRRSSDANTAVPCSIELVKAFDVSTVHDPKGNIAAEVSRRISFGANSIENLSEKGTCHMWKPVYSVPQTVGVSSPAPSFVKQVDAKELQKSSRESRPRASGVKNVRRSYKSNAEDKTQSLSGKAADKENAKGVKGLIESISKKNTKAGSNNSISASPTSPGTMAQVLQRGKVRSLGFTEGSSTKSCVVTTVQTSNVPDLNSSVSPYSLFQQPFTAFQQVQLRAQIFVYGSIIQGTAPDESCMEAAFGESDGGRSVWENVWRVTVERFHNQKSPLSNAKTPLHPHNDSRSTETLNQTVHRSEASSVSNTPFSSPTWSVPSTCRDGLLSMSMPKVPLGDSSKKFIPLQPYQSSHARHYVGNTSPWPTPVPSPGTWVVTPQSAAVASVHLPTLPISETVRVTSVRESVPQSLGMQHAPPNPNSFIHMSSPLIGSASKPLVMDAKGTTISPAKHASAESKPRKRRRNVASEEQGHISPLVQPWRNLMSVSTELPITVAPPTTTAALNVASGSLMSGNLPGQTSSLVQSRKDPISVSAQSPGSVAPATGTSAMSVASGSLVSGSSLVTSTHRQIVDGGATEQRVWFSEEMYGKIEGAKREAEDASGLAATAVRHCQNIWTQLAVQKNSGAVSEIEAKLGSSAVAIAAAASVAKVASDAALQAKLMADEAFHTSKSVNHTLETSFQEDVQNLGRVTPSSILKGRDKIANADSVLGVVREAARKRVEAASAAAKRAENLGALLKAAEMTAEAVSQAGTIIAMGEPLPFTLTELVDAGPEGYWKVQQKSSQLVNSNYLRREETYKGGVEEGSGGSVEQLNEKLLDKNETNQIVDQRKVLSCEELSRDSADNRMLLVNDAQWGSVSSSGKGLEEHKGCSDYDLSKTIGVIPESQIAAEKASLAIPNDECSGHLRTSNEDKIDEGSLVEVRSEEEGLGTVWFLAKVVSLKDEKASVSYTVNARNEGSSQPTEWVPLHEKGDDAPRIRIPHPLSDSKHEGTKKRSRAARGDYAWSVGDRVDAWIRNGWWEGIITEKSKDDETYLTFKFSAQRETSVVRAWNLRLSLIWEDGRWVEWCRPMESSLSHECDTPQRKPPKKSRLESETAPAVEATGKDTVTKLPVIKELEKPEPPKLLMLSAKEKVFNVGKKTTEGKHSDPLGTKRTGLQKEGSRVVFGVPKPGKKRKFMDVSRHYVSDRANKLREGGDSAKFTKFLVPQESASRGWKNTSKAAFKGKQIAEPNKEAEGHELLLNVASNSISHKKKSSDVAADVQSKGRAAPLGDKSVKNNEKRDGQSFMGNVMPNAIEPRRSVRRIQPTSRLLEGLQSSLIASKIPAASHDKGTKTQQKSLRGRTHG